MKQSIRPYFSPDIQGSLNKDKSIQMQVNFVDLKEQNRIYKKGLMAIIKKVVVSGWFCFGEPLTKFEAEFAKFCGKKYCVGLNSGTDALLLTLLAYGLGPGDEVITVANSYFQSAGVISLIGAKPVFVDIQADGFNIDPAKIEAKITPKTKAIIPVHLCGQPADMEPIVKLAQKYKLTIIEDCCQAHGAKYKGKVLPYTETGAFSFYPAKNLGAFGDGGALVTDNAEIAKKLQYLRNDGSIEKYKHEIFGYKSRLDTLQAAILSFKLKHLPKWNRQRRVLAKLYGRFLKNIPQIKTPVVAPEAYHIYHLYMIECQKRNALQKYLAEKGIGTLIHYPTPIHLQKPYLNQCRPGDFPVAEEKAKNILSLPMYPELKTEEVKYVCRQITGFYSRK